MRYKIVTEENGLGELSYVPMFHVSKVWYPYEDARKRVKRFLNLEAAKVFLDNQHKKRLSEIYDKVEELDYIPGVPHGTV